MKLVSLVLLDSIRRPGGNTQVSYFTDAEGYNIDYDPKSQLITIMNKSGKDKKIVHISRSRELEPA